MPLRLLFLACLFAAPLCPPAQAQQQSPAGQPLADSLGAGVVDSLQAALGRFEEARFPTAADSARLRQWADSAEARGSSIRGSEPADARSFFKQALRAYQALEDSAGVVEATGDLGVAYYYQSRHDEAIARYRKALEISREIGDRKETAVSLNNIGTTYRNQGRYDQALARYREALEVYREIGEREYAASTLSSIGLVYKNQGLYDRALTYLRESLEIKRKIDDRGGIASALNDIGIIYENQKRYEEALSRYHKSLKIKREAGDREGIATTLNNIGLIDRNQERYEEALSRFREALEINREIGDRKDAAITLHNTGTVHYEQDRYEKAVAHYQKALRINRSAGSPYGSILNLWGLGEIRLRQGEARASSDSLRQAVRLAEELRRSATSAEARRSLLSTQIGAYRLLTLAYARSSQPGSALRAAERARARLLADRLAGTATGDTTFTVPPVAALRKTLGPEEAALLYTNAGKEWPLTALVVTRGQVYTRKLPDSTFRAGVQQAYARELRQLQEAQGPLTAALEGRSTIDSTSSLAEAVRLYRHYLTRSENTSIQEELAQRLRSLLIAPLREHLQGKSKLTVVPTGALGYLPFETLRDSAGQYLPQEKQVRYAQSLTVLRQLQKRDYTDRERPLLALGGAAYSPDSEMGNPEMKDGTLIAEAQRGSTRVATEEQASTLFRDASRRLEQGRSPRGVYQQLGYGRWRALPGTKSEVEQLGQVAGEGATVLTGEEALEDTVRALDEQGGLNAYRRVHFATHGVAVPESPELSALVLSQVGASDSLASKDGYLTMEEIAGLDMKADVAVLSACQTGLGKIVAGEGVVSLSHAFLRAGANATLVSQWRVLDKSTRQFMTAVYERAKAEDTSFAEAVTETKRAFIDGEYGEKNTDPLRWAPFVYYGRE